MQRVSYILTFFMFVIFRPAESAGILLMTNLAEGMKQRCTLAAFQCHPANLLLSAAVTTTGASFHSTPLIKQPDLW